MDRFAARSDAELLATSPETTDPFIELYRRHSEDLIRYFMRRTGCAQTAADLTAETFAQALASRKRFRDTGAPGRAWLFKIASRQLSRFIRTEKVSERARRRIGIERIELGSAELERVEQMLDLEPMTSALRAALSTLPASQLEAVTLRVADGLPYREVAERLGCTEGAARVRVSRGLVSLSACLGEPT